MLTSAQVRAARALLDWSQRDLAAKSKLSVPTIKRMEGAMGPERSTEANVDAVRRALEGAGVEDGRILRAGGKRDGLRFAGEVRDPQHGPVAVFPGERRDRGRFGRFRLEEGPSGGGGLSARPAAPSPLPNSPWHAVHSR